MENAMNNGFFTMAMVIQVCAQTDLGSAKKIAVDAVHAFPDAKKENTIKAIKMIEHCTSVKNLGLSMSNFILAHPSEKLKSIR